MKKGEKRNAVLIKFLSNMWPLDLLQPPGARIHSYTCNNLDFVAYRCISHQA